MKIFYFTSAMRQSDYQEFCKKWSIALNPSNQNFHNKLIRCLSDNHTLEVISYRPFNKKYCCLKSLHAETKSDKNITWHYLTRKGNFIVDRINAAKTIKAILSKFKDEKILLLTDTINHSVLSLSNNIAKQLNFKLIGICTDLPYLISDMPSHICTSILKISSKIDGYICLNEKLNNAFNRNKKPFEIINGILEKEKIEDSEVLGEYFFFGGALMEKYGIYNLIDAFKQIKNEKVNLLICGHHAEETRLQEEICKDKRIKFLGLISNTEARKYENHALACINPRPLNDLIDAYSIPSKTIEYLASNSVTISTENQYLTKHFKDNAIWLKTNNIEEIKNALESVLTLSKKARDQMISNANKKVEELYSFDSVNKIVEKIIQKY